MEDILVVGGGIIGSAICYYLTEKGQKVTLIERWQIAGHASGKAGGFLARGWGSGATKPLHTVSFDLIEGLAKTLPLPSYRKIETLQVAGKKGNNKATWLNSANVSSTMMDQDTAQVTPKELTEALFNKAKERGASLVIGTVNGLIIENGQIGGVKLEDGNEIKGGKVIITMGAWSTILGDWLGDENAYPMDGIKSTSLVFTEGFEKLATDEPFALFCGDDQYGCHLEVYPRPNNEVYVCGCGGSDYINGKRLRTGGDSSRPEDIKPNEERVKAACKSFANLTDIAVEKEPKISQACMRPCPPDGLPMIGKIQAVKNLYIAAGHNCWGILWSAATGLVMSELVLNEKLSFDISAFSPARFMKEKKNRGRHQNDQSVGEQW